MFPWNGRRCRAYQVRMEDRLGMSPQAVESDLELVAHLRECRTCREGWAAAQLSHGLFAGADESVVQPSEAFVTRVMASVREAEANRWALWRPVEALASRFSLVASVVLLALSVFIGEVSPSLRRADVVSTAAPSVEMTSDWPEPPAQPVPATQDEVLLSLVGADNGI